MALIDNTKPATNTNPTTAGERDYRTAVKGRIDGLPDALDSAGDETAPYAGRHTVIAAGVGLSPGGDIDMQGDIIGGFSFKEAAGISSNLTIDPPRWKDYRGAFFLATSGSAINITIDDSAISGTAQAGTASTITLAASDTEADDVYNWCQIEITSGTGSGQTRDIIDYVSSTKKASVTPDWSVAPDVTSTYEITARGNLCFMVKRAGAGSVTASAAGGITNASISSSISAQNGVMTVLVTSTGAMTCMPQ